MQEHPKAGGEIRCDTNVLIIRVFLSENTYKQVSLLWHS